MVLGAGGMVGLACVRRLKADGWQRLVTPQRHLYDLTRQHRAEQCIREAKPDAIIMAAGKVGGVADNAANQASYLHDNAAMALSVINAAQKNNVGRLIYLGSSCAYPKRAYPAAEHDLLDGAFEPTNAGYALAKCLGAELCRHYNDAYKVHYTCVMPCNLYGPGDNYTDAGHCVAMLLKRFYEAKATGADRVVVWGTGQPTREIMHVDDLAEAVVLLLQEQVTPPLINVGSGDTWTIEYLAKIIADVVGYTGRIVFDPTKPDGVRRKRMSNATIRRLGWCPRIDIETGLREVYAAEFDVPAASELMPCNTE